MNSKVVG